MKETLKVPVIERDEAWEESFLKLLPLQKIEVVSPDAQNGPDGWPYLLAELNEQGESILGPLNWLSQRGIGLVINPYGETPDYVLSYGMIWNFRERGVFLSPTQPLRPKEQGLTDSLRDGQELFVGAPNESYLPNYARSVLREFFAEQSLFTVKILLISQDGNDFDLSFSWESLGRPPENEHPGILQALSWFLPAHYSLAIFSEESIARPWENL